MAAQAGRVSLPQEVDEKASHLAVIISLVLWSSELGMYDQTNEVLDQATDCELKVLTQADSFAVRKLAQKELDWRFKRRLAIGGVVVAGLGTAFWLWRRSKKS